MKSEVGSYEAKTKLPELLRAVRGGRTFTITNRGEKVARLVPAHGSRGDAKVDTATTDMKAFMHAHRVRGVDTKALREEGRA